jgi:hypothetical protein
VELRTAILDNPAFENIWKSAPNAEDTHRLAHLIFERTDRSPEEIANEYQGWREWIDKILPDKEFGTRTLMWAAAFCDGGQRRSVLRMSEELRQQLDEDRGPAAILSDDPSSKRLTDAEIDANGDTVRLSPPAMALPKRFAPTSGTNSRIKICVTSLRNGSSRSSESARAGQPLRLGEDFEVPGRPGSRGMRWRVR